MAYHNFSTQIEGHLGIPSLLTREEIQNNPRRRTMANYFVTSHAVIKN